NGHYILIYSVNCGQYSQFSPQLVSALASLGSSEINNLITGNNCTPWAFFVRKGDNSTVDEVRGTAGLVLQYSTNFSVNWFQGNFVSPPIGPSFRWKDFYWSSNPEETPDNDINSIDIIGVTPNNAEIVLQTNITAPHQNLSFIDANAYPYIKL